MTTNATPPSRRRWRCDGRHQRHQPPATDWPGGPDLDVGPELAHDEAVRARVARAVLPLHHHVLGCCVVVCVLPAPRRAHVAPRERVARHRGVGCAQYVVVAHLCHLGGASLALWPRLHAWIHHARLDGGVGRCAYVSRPLILIADEPTGNLDPSTSVGIMKLLDRINREGTTVLMATHDSGIVDQMRKRVIELDAGHVIRDQVRGVYGYTG